VSLIRVCFLGTPEFAAVSLRRMLADEHFDVVGVVTQPDRPAGRKLQLAPSAVKVVALEHGLPIVTPENLRKDPDAVSTILSWGAEVAVVVAFGQILEARFLSAFRFGCVNVHASLLPRWRGAAPIQRALEAGDFKTGVCLQKMVLKLDAGDLLGSRSLEIGPDMNSQELHDQLANLGADLLHVELMDYLRGNLVGTPQDETLVTYAKKIEKAESEIDFSKSSLDIHNKVRAFVWGPGTFTHFAGRRLKIHKTRAHPQKPGGVPGVVLEVGKNSFWVSTGEGALEIIEVQPESKSRMSAADFITGFQLQKGAQFE
jgi:methionyl-tRNA formyltransferase